MTLHIGALMVMSGKSEILSKRKRQSMVTTSGESQIFSKKNSNQWSEYCALRPGQNEGYGLLEMDYETIRFFIKIKKLF